MTDPFGVKRSSLPPPTRTGSRRLAGIDLQKARMRTVTEAVLALAPKPGGFTAKELARKVNEFSGTASTYSPRQAAYDLSKLRGKESKKGSVMVY